MKIGDRAGIDFLNLAFLASEYNASEIGKGKTEIYPLSFIYFLLPTLQF